MKTAGNDILINHCPDCGGLCLMPHSKVEHATSSGQMIKIICHICASQFTPGPNIDPWKGQYSPANIAADARMAIANCPSCAQPISVPDPLPDDASTDLICPLCEDSIDVKLLEISLPSSGDDHKTTPVNQPDDVAVSSPTVETAPKSHRKRGIIASYTPVYLLILLLIGGYLYWARETGQLPIDEWISLIQARLGTIS